MAARMRATLRLVAFVTLQVAAVLAEHLVPRISRQALESPVDVEKRRILRRNAGQSRCRRTVPRPDREGSTAARRRSREVPFGRPSAARSKSDGVDFSKSSMTEKWRGRPQRSNPQARPFRDNRQPISDKCGLAPSPEVRKRSRYSDGRHSDMGEKGAAHRARRSEAALRRDRIDRQPAAFEEEACDVDPRQVDIVGRRDSHLLREDPREIARAHRGDLRQGGRRTDPQPDDSGCTAGRCTAGCGRPPAPPDAR